VALQSWTDWRVRAEGSCALHAQVCVAVFAGGGLYMYSRTTISTASLHRWALAKLAKDERVRAALGQNVVGGSLKAYAVEQGHFSISQRLAWVAPRAQILFQVRRGGCKVVE
jgi:hypothetical protein